MDDTQVRRWPISFLMSLTMFPGAMGLETHDIGRFLRYMTRGLLNEVLLGPALVASCDAVRAQHPWLSTYAVPQWVFRAKTNLHLMMWLDQQEHKLADRYPEGMPVSRLTRDQWNPLRGSLLLIPDQAGQPSMVIYDLLSEDEQMQTERRLMGLDPDDAH